MRAVPRAVRRAVDDAFARIARSAGGDQAAFRELIDLAPPGIDEVIAVADVAEALTESQGRLRRHRHRHGADRARAAAAADAGGAARLDAGADGDPAEVPRDRRRRDARLAAGAALEAAARAPGRSSRTRRRRVFVVVTRAAALPAAESAALIASLGSLGIAVQAVIVNALGAGRARAAARLARAQADEIERLRCARRTSAVTLSSRRPPRCRRRTAPPRWRRGARLAANHLMAQGTTAVYLYCVVRAARARARRARRRRPGRHASRGAPSARLALADHGRTFRSTSTTGAARAAAARSRLGVGDRRRARSGGRIFFTPAWRRGRADEALHHCSRRSTRR